MSQTVLIEGLAQEYFRILHECDAEAASALFHPQCRLFWHEAGEIRVMPIDDYLEVLRTRPSPKSRGFAREGEIAGLSFNGPDSATLRVYSAVGARRFCDELSLVRGADGWRIVCKSYRLRAAAVQAS